MKILQVTNFCFILGGGSRYFFEVSKLLKKNGHEVAFFCMDDKKNIKTKWCKYFLSNIPLENRNIIDNMKLLFRMIYSHEAKVKIFYLIDNFHPDVVHLHDIYHYLSPSILPEFKKRQTPIVMTVHDYHLVAPNRNLFHNGSICEISKKTKFYKAFFHKCIKNSYLISLVEILEKYFTYLFAWDRNSIDIFITPSQFMRNKLIEYGVDPKKIIHLPYFIDSSKYIPNYQNGDYILYFGRLSPEKGINYLIKAMRLFPKIKLKIVGRGNEEYKKELRSLSVNADNIEFLGFKNGDNLKKIIAKSKFTILPSLWYDVAPISILESFASGKPVIASNIGGIPELVKDDYNGYLFKTGDIEDCVEKINKLWNNPALCKEMGKNAREYVEKNFGPEEHYEKLMGIYKLAIEKQ